MFFLILEIIVWFLLGWLAGWWMRRTYLSLHIGWTRQDEIASRLYILLGGFVFLGVGIMWAVYEKKCHKSDKEYQERCIEYTQSIFQKYPSWFGKSSDYDKVIHPEILVWF